MFSSNKKNASILPVGIPLKLTFTMANMAIRKIGNGAMVAMVKIRETVAGGRLSG